MKNPVILLKNHAPLIQYLKYIEFRVEKAVITILLKNHAPKYRFIGDREELFEIALELIRKTSCAIGDFTELRNKLFSSIFENFHGRVAFKNAI